MPMSQTDLAEILPLLRAVYRERRVSYRCVQSLDAVGDSLLDYLRKDVGSPAETLFRTCEQRSQDNGQDRTLYLSTGNQGSDRESLNFLNRHRDTRLFIVSERTRGDAPDALMALAHNGWMPIGSERLGNRSNTIFASVLAPRDCSVRLASRDDMAALLTLESQCWAEGLQASESQLRARLGRFPEGQYVLVDDDMVVGAIYSQRISAASFAGVTSDDAHRLHDADGSIVQLLALNVAPTVQDRGFGDLLLEFALLRASAMPGIREVVGVTRCRDYAKRLDLSLSDYVDLRSEHGGRIDPILRLHELHGAQISGLVPGYRPNDRVNQGAGVLVRYDLRERGSTDPRIVGETVQDRPADVAEFVRHAVADLLALPLEHVSVTAPLFELGLDSASLLALNERLSSAFAVAIEPAFFFEHNTCARIAEFLECQDTRADLRASAQKQRDSIKTAATVRSADVAIVGLACRLPGGVETPAAFWELLRSERDAITTLPEGRWRWPGGFDASAHPGIELGGFLDDIAGFDAAFFRISPREAAGMDPQQRLLMEAAWHCIEDAGLSPSVLAGSETGVFVGASGSDYHLRLCEQPIETVEGHFALGSSMAVLANRLSYFYDFNGPSLQIDTACSSSLVALHEAVTALRNGTCARAFVAGVNILCHPANSISFYRAGMLSKDGRCKTFDGAADGYVRGEGVVALLLRPLDAALADGDRIHAIIKGTATNHGGLAAGLTVPNPAKQADLVRRALVSADVRPETITYVEAHGTGTALGDPVEIRGLKQALSPEDALSPCYIGSVKTNIGHLEAAAGLAGVLKTVLALQNETIPASLNFTSLNPHFTLDDSRFKVATTAVAWPRSDDTSPLRAGVSSFGSGGANAHVILQEARGLESEAVRTALPAHTFEHQRYWLSERSAVVPDEATPLDVDDLPSKVKKCLSDILDIPAREISETADLRSIGLDSIGSLKLQQRLEQDLGVVLSGLSILDVDTLGELIELVSKTSGVTLIPEVEVPRVDAEQSKLLPLSEGQKGLWALQTAMPDLTAFNLAFAIRAEAAIDPARFETAIRATLIQHPVLGESLVETTTGPRRSPDAALLPIICEDASHLSGEEVRLRLRDLSQIPFDLAQFAPVRAHLITANSVTYILIVIHHVAFDAGSIQSFFQCLLDCYFDDQILSDVSTSDAGYAQFIDWEAKFIGSPAGALAREHFRRRLSDLPSPLEHPEDVQAQQDLRGVSGSIAVAFSPEESDSVERFCRDERVTPASFLLTAYLTALTRYAGRNDLVIGVTTAGRRRAEFEGVVGYFVNVVPVRLQHDATKTWGAAARAVQRTLAADLDHGAYPFAALVRDLAFPRAPGRSPVFQAVFNHQSYFSPDAFRALERRYAAHAPLAFIDELRQDASNELEFETAIAGGKLLLRLKYDARVVAEAAAEGLIVDVRRLIAQAAQRPDQRLSDALVVSSVDLAVSGSGDFTLTLPDRIAQQARRTPDAIAYRFRDRTLTYAELDRRSTCLAHALTKRGVGADRVGVCLQRSLNLPVVLLGVMKAGAAYVPIEPDHPTQRLAQIVDDSAPKIIITQIALATKVAALASGDVRVLAVEDVDFDADHPVLPLIPDAASRAAYVIYTSGSTGKPKGVVIGQRALVSALSSLVDKVGVTGGDHLLAVTTFGFDIAGFELFGPLLAGASCTICEADIVADAARLTSTLAAVRPTILQAVPSLWSMLFDDGWTPAMGLRLVCGGEALPIRLRQQFEASGCVAWNVYGPTEATIWASAQRVAAGEPDGVGKPLANTRLYIVDEHMRRVRGDAIGELCIAGDGLADGYFNRPDLTDERFVSNPFEDAGKLYRTGDRARWLVDGSVAVLGRLDGQVKVRGYRIELSDIEKNLAAHAGVKDAVVVVDVRDGHSRLVAYCTRSDAPEPDASSLRAHLNACLPPYMVPARFQMLDRFPLTANGKIDRLALSEGNFASGNERSTPTLRVAIDLERALTDIWTRVLAVPSVGRDETFFDAGGDSVLAVSVARQIATAMGRAFTVTDLFRHPTIASLSQHLAGDKPACALVEGGSVQEFPVSSDSIVLSDAVGYAIVGISCRFPDAEGLDRFWDNLLAGRDAVRTPDLIDLKRRRAPVETTSDSRFVGARATLEGKQFFDAGFFRVAPRDAERMHPQTRLLLMHSWAAVEDAGYAASRIPETAVFLSASHTAYGASPVIPGGPDTARVLSDFGVYQQWLLDQPGTLPTLVSNRLGFTGPSCFVHSNCSSGLVALDLACQALQRGEAHQALVGAASVLSQWSDGYIHQDGLNFAKGGRIRAFSAEADGMIAGEGVAVVMLKRHADAVRDGDHIYAVVRGVAVNNDGSAKAGYYAPSVQGQAAAIGRALSLSNVDPADIAFIEAHGTGTALGDPIEVAAIKDVFQSSGLPNASCGLGSVKSNIGHTDVVAGLAGLIKSALALKHGIVPPTLHADQVNPQLELEPSPLFVVTSARELSVSDRFAAVSSFGIGGTNAHAILERVSEAGSKAQTSSEDELFLLSAMDRLALERQVRRLLDALGHIHEHDLPDVAFTLQAGREPLAVRLAICASTKGDLIRLLQQWLEGESKLAGVHVSLPAGLEQAALSSDPDFSELIQRWLARRRLSSLAKLWCQGHAVDWTGLARVREVRRVRLPSYAFEETPFWAADAKFSTLEERAQHPLLGENISTLRRIAFMTRLSGTEDFVADHVVNGVRVLPAVIHLEMARAAAARFFEVDDVSIALGHVFWLKPLVVDGDTRVIIDIEIEADNSLSWSIGVEDMPDDGESRTRQCSRGQARVRDPHEAQAAFLDIAALRSACQRRVEGQACYERFTELGFEYGPSYRTLVQLSAGNSDRDDLFALGDIHANFASSDERLLLQPGVADAMLQCRIGFDATVMGAGLDQGASMPFSIEDLVITAPTPHEGVIWARAASGVATDGDLPALDIDIADETGRVCVAIRGLISRTDTRQGSDRTLLLRSVWQDRAPGSALTVPQRHRVVLVGPKARASAIGDAVSAQMPQAHALILNTDGSGLGDVYRAAAVELLVELKALARGSSSDAALVQLVICGADGDATACAGLSGLLATALLEYPSWRGQTLVFADDVCVDDVATKLISDARQSDSQIRYCGAEPRRCLAWEEIDVAAHERRVPWRTGGVYLITGGFGGLGLLFAEDIAHRAPGATIILAGRTAPDETVQRRIGQIEALGARVDCRAVDVSDADAVVHLIADVVELHGPMTGVVHAAGVLRDGLMAFKSVPDFDYVLRSKVDGTLNLDAATADQPLELFVLFGSVSGALGSAGQSDYAAANAFLDAFADLRGRQASQGERPGQTLALDWPLWADGGMHIDAATQRQQEDRGHAALSSSAGLAAFDAAVASGERRVMVLSGHAAKLRNSVLPKREIVSGAATQPIITHKSVPESSSDVPSSRLREQAAEYVRRSVSQVMKLPASQIEVAADLDRYGIDSVIAVDLVVFLEKSFGLLPKTLLFERRSVADLADYFLTSHRDTLLALVGTSGVKADSKPAVPPVVKTAPIVVRSAWAGQKVASQPRGKANDDVAIIGLAGRYPKSKSLTEFWTNLRNGTDCITEVPADRWDHARYFDPDKSRHDKTYGKWGGFIEGVDECDPLFFSIAPREMAAIDPQERLFLQAAYEAVEDAGYTRESLAREPGASAKVAVYVGVMYAEYQLFGAQDQTRGGSLTLTGSPASIANRVSYFFNFTGPSIAVDTMCSSSLTAIHLACRDLNDDCDYAIAGGVNISIHPNKYLFLAQHGFISSEGRCAAFGQGGDGYVPGEGVGAVLLKRLSRAQEDGDRIYGVIRGTAVNHGGKTNGYTVPNPVAQGRVIESAIRASGVDARELSYIEAHGTGTSLGDPIEIAGLSRAFSAFTPDRGFCAIGSAKSNIGHCESAAGIAGLTKVLLQMQHGELVPSLHSETLNPHIDFSASPFVVQRELAPWHRPRSADGRRELPRIAGISSFGAGGSNAHLVIEEYQPPVSQRLAENPGLQVVVLSARNEERLRVRVQELVAALSSEPLVSTDFADIAFTLQIGRDALDERLALTANSVSEAREKLEAWLAGKTATSGLWVGRRRDREGTLSLLGETDLAEIVNRWMSEGQLDRIAEAWSKGVAVDWHRLHGAVRRQRVALPTYPFERQRHRPAEAHDGLIATHGALAHPLVHENVSDLYQHKFKSRFHGGEAFFNEHRVKGASVLPAAAHLEMARYAVATLSHHAGGLRITDVALLRPLRPEATGVDVAIEVEPDESGRLNWQIAALADAGGQEAHVYSQGKAELLDSASLPAFDVAALNAKAWRDLPIIDLYRRFADGGLSYGPSFQGLQQLSVLDNANASDRLVSARVVLQGTGDRARFGLDPAILDAAFQATLALDGSIETTASKVLDLPVPFAIEEVTIYGACQQHAQVFARYAEGSGPDAGLIKIDVDVVDENGDVCVEIRGLTGRSASRRQAAHKLSSTDGAVLLTPVWEPVRPAVVAPWPTSEQKVCILGRRRSDDALHALLPGAHVLDLDDRPTIETLTARLQSIGPIDHLIWCVPAGDPTASLDARQIDLQETGVITGFRLVKALLELGYGSRPFAWTTITEQAIATHRAESIDPAHASVHGFLGSATKEHPGWKFRVVDVAAADAVPWEQICSLPHARNGDALAWRGNEWLQRVLLPSKLAPMPALPHAHRGVHVVIGGAGGIGEVWTKHVAERYGTQVVWIGRRAEDASIREKIAGVAAVGPAPIYVQVTATDRRALEAARDKILAKVGPIKGLVHAALVLSDAPLARMDEAQFRASLEAKVNSSVNMLSVFASPALETITFFSSTMSFAMAAGQSNYSAGCAFTDAFAHAVRTTTDISAKVMNWGWWGSVGIVASEFYRNRMGRLGFASVEPDEGMAALRALLDGPLDQAAFLKTTRPLTLEHDAVADETLHALDSALPSVIASL